MRLSIGMAVASVLAATLTGWVCAEEEAGEPKVTVEKDGNVEVITEEGDGRVSIHMSGSAMAVGGQGRSVSKTVKTKNGRSHVSVSISGLGAGVVPVETKDAEAQSKLRSFYGTVGSLKDGTLVLNVEKNTDDGKKVEAKKLACAKDVAVLAYSKQRAVDKSLTDVKAGQNVVVTVKEHDGGPVVTRILIR